MTPFERACCALCELDGNPPGATFEGRPMWESYILQVQAVMKALEAPDTHMIAAGVAKTDEIGAHDLVGIWRAMLEAAGDFVR